MTPEGGHSDRDGNYLEIMSILGHELRRPLTVIRGAATLMLDISGHVSAEKMVELLGLIDGNVEEMSDLIEDLLLAVHMEAGDLRLAVEPVEVSEVVNSAVEAERRRTGEHPVTVRGATPGLIAEADRERSVRALRALIQNAARHAPTDTAIEVVVTEQANQVRLEVLDRGPGIPAAEIPKAFERFSKLGNGPGLGLGLFLVRGLAGAMGGEAAAAERPGGGASVWFTLRRRG